jgi:hypothetical protein
MKQPLTESEVLGERKKVMHMRKNLKVKDERDLSETETSYTIMHDAGTEGNERDRSSNNNDNKKKMTTRRKQEGSEADNL